MTDHRAGGWSKLEGAWNKVIRSMEKGLDFEGAGESSSSSKWPATKEDKARAGRSKDFKALALATYYRAIVSHVPLHVAGFTNPLLRVCYLQCRTSQA